jgi:hypothetical protein
VPRYIAFVEPGSELADIAVKMLLTDVVENAVASALQHRPNGFDAVTRNPVSSEEEGGCTDPAARGTARQLAE